MAVVAGPASAKTIHLFTPPPIGEAGSGPGQLALAAPAGIAANDASGDLYVADAGNGRVDQFQANGTFIRSFGSFTTPAFLAVDNSAGGEGSVYVADTSTSAVSKFKADGTLVSAWGTGGQLTGNGSETFTELDGVAVNSAGNLFVLNGGTHMSVFEPDGTFAESESFELTYPAAPLGFAIDNSGSASSGDIYTRYFEGTETLKFSPSGTFLGEPDKNSGTGIAVDSTTGDLYVATGIEVLRYDNTGARLESFGSAHISQSAGLAIGAAGTVYVSDTAAQQIERFAAATVPDATTEAATEVTRQTATLNGTVGAAGGPEATCLFQYETEAQFQANPESERFEGAEEEPCSPAGPFTGSSTEAVSAALSGLELETTYRFRLLATNENGSDPGEALAFTTAPAVTVTTTEATAITGSSATLGGEINPEGVALEECFFEYGTTTAYGHTAGCVPDAAAIGSGNSPVPVHADLTGLNGGTEYHFRLVAKNSFGTNHGADLTFITLGPSVTATSASEVTATTATLETELNPHGLPTTYHFEYDTVEYSEGGGPHGESTPTASAGAGEADVLRSASVSGLAPATTYHYRVLATNSLGTVEGPDRSFTTQSASASTALPDNRGYELVSPPLKQGAPLGAIAQEGGLIQAAADGSAITYFATGSIIPEPAGNRSSSNSQDLSARTPSGWSTKDITLPNQQPVGIAPGNLSEYKLFSADLSLAAVEPLGATPLSSQASERTPYLRRPDGSYTPLVYPGNVPEGTKFGGEEGKYEVFGNGVVFVTATPSLSHVLFDSPSSLVSGFENEGFDSVYEWSAGVLTPVSWAPSGPATLCGGTAFACVPAGEAEVGNRNLQVRGAISADGSRVVFSAGVGSLYLRDLPRGETLLLDAPQEGSGKAGHATFQTASADGRRVFFTDDEKLTEDSTAAQGKPDLYMCQIEETPGGLACSLTDLTANAANPAEPAAVQGAVIGAAEDGSSVYFVANGALVEGAVEGDCTGDKFQSASNSCNLYRYDLETESIQLLAVLSGADNPDWATASGGHTLNELTARVSPNGRYLAFMSERPLTGYDNRDAASGERDEEVFLYDAQGEAGGTLLCASCNPSGARPQGTRLEKPYPGPLVDGPQLWEGRWVAANVPGWTGILLTRALYQSRYLSDSGRLFFNAADALVPADTNATEDVYQLEPAGVGNCTETSSTFSTTNGGCVSLISSGTSSEESAFMDASESGNDVFFLTASRLTARDEDKALDLYDARVGGGEAPPVKPVECSGDACQQPAVPPNHPTPGTLLQNGPENAKECPKGKVKKHGKCVAKHHRKHHRKKSHRRAAGHNRGGGK